MRIHAHFKGGPAHNKQYALDADRHEYFIAAIRPITVREALTEPYVNAPEMPPIEEHRYQRDFEPNLREGERVIFYYMGVR